MGFVEGRDFAIEYRWAEGRPERLPVLADELVRRRVTIIATMPNSPAALAAKEATQTVPIVFITGVDPVDAGIVSSYAHPGGNITGFTVLTTELAAKRLELLHELVPAVSTIAFLFNPGNFNNESNEVRNAARQIGVKAVLLPVAQPGEIKIAFARLVDEGAGALLIAADPLFLNNESQLVALAAHHAIPTMHSYPQPVVNGGLMSYAPDRIEVARQLGIYAGRILKGEKPADLPVQRATKIAFLLNLKTAKALGLSVPQSILLRADEVME
jgi:putative tryptophan/tyrosine transport system substrate-binding protein